MVLRAWWLLRPTQEGGVQPGLWEEPIFHNPAVHLRSVQSTSLQKRLMAAGLLRLGDLRLLRRSAFGQQSRECTSESKCTLCNSDGHIYFNCPQAYSNRTKNSGKGAEPEAQQPTPPTDEPEEPQIPQHFPKQVEQSRCEEEEELKQREVKRRNNTNPRAKAIPTGSLAVNLTAHQRARVTRRTMTALSPPVKSHPKILPSLITQVLQQTGPLKWRLKMTTHQTLPDTPSFIEVTRPSKSEDLSPRTMPQNYLA
ncbi:uncharacterized protein LOC115193019 [Salmo trutta]|uniref:uncharacterized protein LOC115193019 n=1 Tax=Salmo trutta TaxID=8032 RepID=UPI001130ABD8|nr:uncharacterized protein LOC115193019 [Salmo trutta]